MYVFTHISPQRARRSNYANFSFVSRFNFRIFTFFELFKLLRVLGKWLEVLKRYKPSLLPHLNTRNSLINHRPIGLKMEKEF